MSTQCQTLLDALKRGEKLTVATALMQYGVYALSQRVGELRKAGHPITPRMVEVNGKRIAQYSYEPEGASA